MDRKANKNTATERGLCYIVPLVLFTTKIITKKKKKLSESFELLNLRLSMYSNAKADAVKLASF